MLKKGVLILGVILALIVNPTIAKAEEQDASIQVAQANAQTDIPAMTAMAGSVDKVGYSELELLARVVEAEAGNQGLYGKRLVVAVIYNRVESEKFPNTVYEVLTSPHQFSTVWNGAINKVNITPETLFAIEFERAHRADNEILYFNNGACSGKFAYKYGWHNFGK